MESGLLGACHGGYKELVEFMIAKGADDRNMALYGTCSEGYKELTQLIIGAGADRCLYCDKSIDNISILML